jgi:hypothetical protein
MDIIAEFLPRQSVPITELKQTENCSAGNNSRQHNMGAIVSLVF